MSANILSSSDYVERLGAVCPVCGSEDQISTDTPEFDGSCGWANVSCGKCKSTWTDQFTLIGYSDLVVGSDSNKPVE